MQFPQYFFTVNHEYFHAKDHLRMTCKGKMLIRNIEFIEVMEDDGRPPDSDEEEEDNTPCNYSIGIMNYTSGKPKEVLDEDYEPTCKTCRPRPPDKVYVKPRNRRPRTPWSFPISIFKNYEKDNEEILNKCFEFDWKCLKLPKMSDEELTEIKEALKPGYKMFKNVYKYLAGVGKGAGGVFCIPLN